MYPLKMIFPCVEHGDIPLLCSFTKAWWVTVAVELSISCKGGKWLERGRCCCRRMHEKSPRLSWNTRRSCKMWRWESTAITLVFRWNSWKREEWFWLFWSYGEVLFFEVAPSKFNLDPKNQGLQDVFSFANERCSGSMLVFQGITTIFYNPQYYVQIII